jgi:PIN domain-containing protein
MQVFIDANVFLSFYHFTSEDLVQLEKLAHLIEEDEILLQLPRQVIDETWRNRANKIKPALDALRKHTFAPKYPVYCKGYAQYAEMRRAAEFLEKQRSALVDQIDKDIEARNLGADKLLRRLFDAGKVIETSVQIVNRARLRSELGHPPGKKGSIGDAVNWESLLVEPIGDLHVISEDGDFASALDETKFDDFLQDEWKKKARGGKVTLYRSLTPFLRQHYPDIDLRVEEEKQALIEKLYTSSDFATTHQIIAALSEYGTAFTPRQVDQLYNALLENNQVRWIARDADVLKFYRGLTNDIVSIFRPRSIEVIALLRPSKEEAEATDEDAPF